MIFHCYVSSPEGNHLLKYEKLSLSLKQQNNDSRNFQEPKFAVPNMCKAYFLGNILARKCFRVQYLYFRYLSVPNSLLLNVCLGRIFCQIPSYVGVLKVTMGFNTKSSSTTTG